MSSFHLLYVCCFFSVWCWTFWQCMKGVNGERDAASRIMEAIEKDG